MHWKSVLEYISKILYLFFFFPEKGGQLGRSTHEDGCAASCLRSILVLDDSLLHFPKQRPLGFEQVGGLKALPIACLARKLTQLSQACKLRGYVDICFHCHLQDDVFIAEDYELSLERKQLWSLPGESVRGLLKERHCFLASYGKAFILHSRRRSPVGADQRPCCSALGSCLIVDTIVNFRGTATRGMEPGRSVCQPQALTIQLWPLPSADEQQPSQSSLASFSLSLPLISIIVSHQLPVLFHKEQFILSF